MEQEMATQSCILIWEILWTEEPAGLQSMGSQSWTQLSNWPRGNKYAIKQHTEEKCDWKKCYTVTHTYIHKAHTLALHVYGYKMSHT